jgi:hypothetical protein
MPRMSPNLASEMEGFTGKYRTKRDIKAGYSIRHRDRDHPQRSTSEYSQLDRSAPKKGPGELCIPSKIESRLERKTAAVN